MPIFHKHNFVPLETDKEIIYCTLCGKSKNLHEHKFVFYCRIKDSKDILIGEVLKCEKCGIRINNYS